MGPEKRFQMEAMGDDLVNWLMKLQIEVRKWKKKIDYWHFEKQLTPLRNYEREWQEEIDPQSLSFLRSLLCFGLCLPSELRTSFSHGHLKTQSASTTPAATPRISGQRPANHSSSAIDEASAYPKSEGMTLLKGKVG